MWDALDLNGLSGEINNEGKERDRKRHRDRQCNTEKDRFPQTKVGKNIQVRAKSANKNKSL